MSDTQVRTTIADCCHVVRDSVRPEHCDSLPYIGLEHIGEGSLSLIGVGSASDVTSTKSRFRQGDILFGKLRPYFRKVVRPNFDGICSTDIWVIRPKQGVNAQFLFYVLAGSDFVDMATRGAEGTRMPRAKWDYVSSHGVLLPPIAEQCRIAEILCTLDDRIEVSRRMCGTLEEMAQALYKAWFVDFEPVLAKMEGRWLEGESLPGLPAEVYCLFPDELVDSQLGPIPAGWPVGNLRDRMDISPPRQANRASTGYIKHIEMASVPTSSPFIRDWKLRQTATGCRVQNGDTIVARITPSLENGKVAYVDSLDDGEVACGSTELVVLKPIDPWPSAAAYLLAASNSFRAFAIKNMHGTSGRQRVSADILGGYSLPLPPNALMVEFGKAIQPLFLGASTASRLTSYLVEQREVLLPRLMSGEVRIPEEMELVSC